MVASFLTHICVTRPQWVKSSGSNAGNTQNIQGDPTIQISWIHSRFLTIRLLIRYGNVPPIVCLCVVTIYGLHSSIVHMTYSILSVYTMMDRYLSCVVYICYLLKESREYLWESVIKMWSKWSCVIVFLHIRVTQLSAWWRHQIETLSALPALCARDSAVPSQRPVTRSFDFFFVICTGKGLSKQLKRRWFETPSRSLWRHCNGLIEWVVKFMSSKSPLTRFKQHI